MAALESTWLEESSLHERGCKSGTLICNPWLCWAPALKQAYTSMSKSPEKSIRDEGEGGEGKRYDENDFQNDRNSAVWLF